MPIVDAAGQAFEIENAAEGAEKFVALDGPGSKLLDGVEARFDFCERDFRAQNPASQEPRAHARGGLIERGDERRGRVIAADRFDQFQIADRDLIERQGFLLLVIVQRVEMLETADRPWRCRCSAARVLATAFASLRHFRRARRSLKFRAGSERSLPRRLPPASGA